mgnify:CR=1 FL=1
MFSLLSGEIVIVKTIFLGILLQVLSLNSINQVTLGLKLIIMILIDPLQGLQMLILSLSLVNLKLLNFIILLSYGVDLLLVLHIMGPSLSSDGLTSLHDMNLHFISFVLGRSKIRFKVIGVIFNICKNR